MKFYIDGGCKNSNQKDYNKRTMVSVVTDEHGEVLREEWESGGSNNIAEFKALLLALEYSKENNLEEIRIVTDSRIAIAWFYRSKFNEKRLSRMNNPEYVLELHKSVSKLKKEIDIWIRWEPREGNLAGQYIENKYTL